MKPACWDAACRRVRHVADDAAIVVAEFAANAVLHARCGFTVTLTVQPAVVRISVRDDSPLPAVGTRAALPVAPMHGLGAVAALAARWGPTRRTCSRGRRTKARRTGGSAGCGAPSSRSG